MKLLFASDSFKGTLSSEKTIGERCPVKRLSNF